MKSKFMVHAAIMVLLCGVLLSPLSAAEKNKAQQTITTDLLVVGGTESGWAAAIQAARMGVPSITLVNDIHWLGGQMTAEGLVAIDENRSLEKTRKFYKQRPPSIPRSGLFKELTDRIEAFNRNKYGAARPGNTTVGTTCRPAEAEAIFRRMIEPYVKRGQIRLISNHFPVAAMLANDHKTLREVRFRSTKDNLGELTVRAKITIDASDWGDVIQQSGAAFEYGPDLKSKYHEPLAPTNRSNYPLTDMNPITYCMIVEESDTQQIISRPFNYDQRRYFHTTGLTGPQQNALNWTDKPLSVMAPVERIYGSRRIVDHYNLKNVKGPDSILLCWFVQDYPLDVLPPHVAAALEKTELGASKKNIVTMSREQRKIVFEDAKQHSLGMLYHLQTTAHDSQQDKRFSFKRFQLSDEFGTPDKMPFKPYIRESLRLKAMYVLRQQDTTPLGNQSETYGNVMFHDGVTAWQFEYDFHPTGRMFLKDQVPDTAWQSYFKTGRTWGPPYSGLCLFPLRSLIPEKIDGLLGAQKNLGYSSIVSSAVRLHDQSIHIGQASGAAAAVSLRHNVPLRTLPFNRKLLTEIRSGLCGRTDDGLPLAIWPFRDLTTDHPAYEAANLLAVSGMFPLRESDVDFNPDLPATLQWRAAVLKATRSVKQLPHTLKVPTDSLTRGQFSRKWWETIRNLPDHPYKRIRLTDADGDGIADSDDALPLDPNNKSLPPSPVSLHEDGLINALDKTDFLKNTEKRFNFTGKGSKPVPGFLADHGLPFEANRGYGWSRDISQSYRRRGKLPEDYRDTFLFTRGHDRWECAVEPGVWIVTCCIGDSGHQQFDQRVSVEGVLVFDDVTTPAGRFLEKTVKVNVSDGRLTIDLGKPSRLRNTCLNWIQIARARSMSKR